MTVETDSSSSSSEIGAVSPAQERGGVWSKEEHAKFLEAIQLYPKGPWRAITEHVGTRSVRQVQTHAQKYQEKVARRERGLQKNRQKVVRTEHHVDEATFAFVHRPRAPKGRRKAADKKKLVEPLNAITQEITQEITALEITETSSSPPPSPPLLPLPLPMPTPLPPPPQVSASLPAPIVTVVNNQNQIPQPGPPRPHLRMEVIHEPFVSHHRELESPDILKIVARDSDEILKILARDSDDILRETASLFDIIAAHPDSTNTPSSPSIAAPREKKQKLGNSCRYVPDVPTVDESLDFFIKIMSIWGANCLRVGKP